MPEQMQENPIYKFMRANDLTKLDEKAFMDKYSAPEKAKEIHSFMVSNKLTDLDDAKFYDKYLKKKVGGEESSLTKSPSISQEYLREGQGLADKGFIKTEKLDPSQLVSQYRSPDISLTPKPKKNYYSDKLEKGLIFDKEGKLYEPSSEALTKAIAPAEEIDLKKPTQKDLVEKSREMPVEEEAAPIEKQGWLLNTVSALDKGFYKNFISNPIKGLGTLLQGATKKVLGGTGEGFISDKLIQYGDYLNKAIDELTPQDEEFKNTLWDQAAQALGQVGSIIVTGGIAGVGKGATAALVSEVPKGALVTATKALSSQLSSPTAVSAGLSMGQAEFDRAKEAGATDDQAFEAFYKNAAVGSVLETIPVMQFFKRFNNSTGGSVANYIKTKGVAGLTGGIEEMATEVMQQIYSNKTAKDIYNINQDILDGVGSSGGIGFGVGFLLNAMGANAKILRKQGREQEATVLENQVKQYEDNLENPKVTSGNKVSAKDIVTQGVEIGTQKAVRNLDRDLANNVITPEQYQEGMAFAEKAAQVADKIPETVTGESRVKSIELLVERDDINQANQNLLQQKQTTDVAYHAGIDEEIKANEERIKKIDSEVYNITKKPSKEFGTKKYVVDGEEVSQEAFEALQGKPLGTKEIIKAESPEVSDIEKRRQEELNSESGRIVESTEIWEDREGRLYRVDKLKNGKQRLAATNEGGQLLSVIDTYEGSVSPTLFITDGKKIKDQEVRENKIADKINAKFDAELAALEKVKPTEVELVTSKDKNEKFDTPTLKSPASNYEKLYVPRNVVEEAYKNDKDNNPVFGNGNQSLDTIIKRGGYSIEELDKLYPNWKESKTEVKPTEVTLEEEYNSKNVDELIALKKKLYPSPDIESPMTPDEKLLDRVIAKKFSEKQQEIISKRKAAEKAPTKELAEGESVEFNTPEGNKIKGERVIIPGFEKIDMVIVKEGLNNVIYDLASGTPIAEGDFTKENAIKSIKDDFESRNITQDKIYNLIYKSTNTSSLENSKNRVPQINPSSMFESYSKKRKAFEKAEYEKLPLKFNPEEIKKLKELKKRAEDFGIEKMAKEIEGAIITRAKEGTFKPKTDYYEGLLKKDIDEKIKKEAEDKGVPYPKEYLKETPRITMNRLKEIVNEGFKRDKFESIPEDVRKIMLDGYQKNVDILNKYGYYPDENTKTFFDKLYQYVAAQTKRENKESQIAEAKKELISALGYLNKAHEKEFGKKAEAEVKPKEKVKVYNAKDLKANPEVLEEDENYRTLTYPKSFVTLSTNMRALKSGGFEKAKIGDVINIFKKDYVIDGFIENKKNPDETKVLMIRVDKDGNLLREQDLSKKEQKEGKAKEFEEEEEIEVEEAEELTKDDLKKAEAKFAAAEDRFKKARNKIEATQVKQAGMFGGEQKGMFAMGGAEAKSTLDPLRKAAKEAKAELDDIRNRIKVQEVAQPELAPVKTDAREEAYKFIKNNYIQLKDPEGRIINYAGKIRKTGVKEKGKEVLQITSIDGNSYLNFIIDKGEIKQISGNIYTEGKDEIKLTQKAELEKLPVYKSTDIKELKNDRDFNTSGYPESFVKIFTDLKTINKSARILRGNEYITGEPKVGDKVNIFNKNYVIVTINNDKNSKIDLYQINNDNNFIRESDEIEKEAAPIKTYQEAVKEKLEADKKRNREAGAERAIVTKEIYRRVDQMDAPEDAEQIALRYLADGGKVSKESVDEAYGSVKRAQLNTGRRELLSQEVKSKDFVQGNETLDQTAHRLWEQNDQRVSETDIRDRLMAEIGNNNTRLEAAEAYLDKYNAEYKQEKEEMRMAELYKEQYLEEQAEIEKELRTPLDEQIEGEASEEHINNLINQYEAEIKGENQQLRPESEGDVSKEASKGKVAEKAETELAKEYKEAVGKASKKAKENAKKEFVDRNFENIVQKLKIQIKCPT